MTPRELLVAARKLVEAPRQVTEGIWSKAATILTRQALECQVAEVLSQRAPGSQAAQFEAQLILLIEVHADRELASRARYTWSALSAASHEPGYELPPAADQLRRWIAVVQELIDAPSRT